MSRYLVLIVYFLTIKDVVSAFGLKCHYSPADNTIASPGKEILTCDPDQKDKFFDFGTGHKNHHSCYKLMILKDGVENKVQKGCTWTGGCTEIKKMWESQANKERKGAETLTSDCYECDYDECNSAPRRAIFNMFGLIMLIIVTLVCV